MKNDYIEFYGKNGITPVHQDVSDLELHYRRRQKLYRQCGIPTIAFNGAQMLEIGPGGGHNALAPVHWGIGHLDLVEPNHAGVDSIKYLFDKQGIAKDKYTIINSQIENYETDKRYDIIVAEGFLGYVSNAADICRKIMPLCREGGVIVITCSDDVCIFPELIKRLIGQIISSDEKTLEGKVNRLIPIFEPQLNSLRGVSRPVKDWIEDNILNPAFANGNSFSISDAIEVFDGFDILGGSPSMFTDYSWYKDVWVDEKRDCRDQFYRKRMALVMAGLPEQILEEDDCNKLFETFSHIKKLENDYENKSDIKIVGELADYMNSNRDLVAIMGGNLLAVYEESISVINALSKGEKPDLELYPNLFKAFGRGLQYMSFMKVG